MNQKASIIYFLLMIQVSADAGRHRRIPWTSVVETSDFGRKRRVTRRSLAKLQIWSYGRKVLNSAFKMVWRAKYIKNIKYIKYIKYKNHKIINFTKTAKINSRGCLIARVVARGGKGGTPPPKQLISITLRPKGSADCTRGAPPPPPR